MAEALATRRVFVSPVGNGNSRDGSVAHPYATMDEALRQISEQHFAAPAEPTGKVRQIEIISLGAPGEEVPQGRAPRYEFIVDPLGSDEKPAANNPRAWPDLPSALDNVAKRHEEGTLALKAGEHLRVSMREVFAATPIERHRHRVEIFAKYLFMAMTALLAVPVIAILTYLVFKAWPALSWEFIISNPRNNMTAGGIWAPLVGTFYLVFISLLAAAPVGILAGVYLNEYARDNWFTRIVNLAVVNLAGVPSIVHALFGVGAFVAFARMGESVLAASCTLAIMTLPVIITSTREALASVPVSFREACWNLGATRWQTIRTIVLPNSISGILTGVILQVSRAAGETAPILFTGAAFSVPVPDKGLGYFFPYSLHDSCMALSYHLYIVMTQVRPPSAAQIASGRSMPLEHLQYGTAVVLIGLVLVVNSLAIGTRLYLRSRKKW